MPPKKKRGGPNRVTFAVKMSTRSCRKPNMNSEENEITVNANQTPVKRAAVKLTTKRGKAGSRVRARKGVARRKKSEVMSVQVDEKIGLVTENMSESQKDVEETLQTHDSIEDVLLNEEEGCMETADVQNSESEACQITEQLENLNVDESQHTESNLEAPSEDENVETFEEQVLEFDPSSVAFTVEYITEEFVPVAENTEVIIDEEIDGTDKETIEGFKADALELLHTLTSNTEEIDLLPSDTLKVNEVKEEPAVKHEQIAASEETTDPIVESSAAPKLETFVDLNVDQSDAPKPELEAPVVPAPQPKTKRKPQRREPRKPAARRKPPKPKPVKQPNDKTEEVRRSSRIKSINVMKQRSKGHGLVKPVKETENAELAATPVAETDKSAEPVAVMPIVESDNKPVKVKSRWRRSSELEMNVLTPASVVLETCGDSEKIAEANDMLNNKQKSAADQAEVELRLKQFVHLKENLYLTDRMSCKEAKKMTCDCFLTQEEVERGEWGCGDDCLNRLLMIECGSFCPIGERCTNKKFQKTQFAPVEVFRTEKKGLGLRAAANIPYGEFILEYVGEVLDHEEFDARAGDYSNDKNRHYYFMSLRADAIIDATLKGNISRFINHSCDPNAETQKWTVNGELRIGFFSTRTILAGEEITFDYRFQRYGKEAQKCYCEASICRGWLGEEPEDEDDEDEEDEEEDAEESEEPLKEGVERKSEAVEKLTSVKEPKAEDDVQIKPKKEKKKRSPRKKPRKDLFEDLDQLDEDIEMLITTGLKNQAHTLKLSRLMVRAKEPAQRTKLLRVLRRGELPCRRLFLDYHGLRLMHGYMTEAQDLAKTDNKYESLRLEMLQTLATLPIPNKTMLQDSKVLPTVEKWSSGKPNELPLDSNSSSPQMEQEPVQTTAEDNTKTEESVKQEVQIEAEDVNAEKAEENDIRKSIAMDYQGEREIGGFTNTHGKELADEISAIFQDDTDASSASFDAKPSKTDVEVKSKEPNYEEEITALALKLLEEWSNLKEVFKIPKKERIEQMKEHEREANRGYIAGLGLEQDAEKKNESRYRILKRYRSLSNIDSLANRKNIKLEDRTIANFPKLGKFERRKMFALQVEQREEERRRKQREMWRQHEQHCILLGTDPRLTAPFDPNRGYQCIWNPQIGQWQNYPLQNPNMIFNPQTAMNIQPSNPTYPYMQPGMMSGAVNPMHPLPTLPYQEEVKKEEDYSQVKFMGPIPPPVKLPPKWKCAKDKYGRPYYYHIKIRKSQWEPPPLSHPHEDLLDDSSETTSSSDTSSLSSDSSSEDSESDEDVNDSKLLLEVRKQMEKQVKPKLVPVIKTKEDEISPLPEEKEEKEDDKSETSDQVVEEEDSKEEASCVDPRTKDLPKEEKPQSSGKKRRAGLVHEIIISPRTEEDRLQFREDLKRFKLNKEKLKKEKELIHQGKKHTKEKRHKSTIKLKMKEMNDSNSETAKKIKETFRSNMATVVVSVLNAYRKPDCKEGRITNTDDFKHLARKLTHFVMLKEMKHIEKIEDLVCTENVKSKAKEYMRKYMSKFGENYQKRNDEPDY